MVNFLDFDCESMGIYRGAQDVNAAFTNFCLSKELGGKGRYQAMKQAYDDLPDNYAGNAERRNRIEQFAGVADDCEVGDELYEDMADASMMCAAFGDDDADNFWKALTEHIRYLRDYYKK